MSTAAPQTATAAQPNVATVGVDADVRWDGLEGDRAATFDASTEDRPADDSPPDDRRAILTWLAEIGRPELLRVTVASILGASAQLIVIVLAGGSAWLAAQAADQPAGLFVAGAIVVVRGSAVGRAVLRYTEKLVTHQIADRVLSRTRVRIYLDVERAGPAGAGQLRGGDMLSRILGDVDAVQDLVARGVLPMLMTGFTGLAAVTGFAMVHPLAGFVLLLGLLISGVVAPYLTVRAAGAAERRAAPAREELAVPTIELLTGSADLHAYRAAERWLDRIGQCDARLTRLSKRTSAGVGIGAATGAVGVGFAVVLELSVGIWATQTGAMSASWLPVLAVAPLVVFDRLGTLPGAAGRLVRGIEAAGRLRRLADLPKPPVFDGAVHLNPGQPVRLEVSDLSVRWPGASEPMLSDISLDLRPGRRIGVVGESGAGKTTLVTAILGYLAAESGEVRLNGMPMSEVAGTSIRRAMAVCAQDAHLFDTTIRDNLVIARPDATPFEISDALRKARLLDWVEQLPLGLDTPVGERGVRLSGGERQRLMLARTLLADPAIMLLDEPTAHLDEPTSAALMRDLLVATVGRSTLLVTHRLAGLSVVDEILVLAGGRIIQRGTPTELMENAGPYRKMWFRAASTASSLTGLPVTGPDGSLP